MSDYVFLADLREHAPMPENGILSRTIHADARSKVIQFIFAPGQELSAHTAPMPAILQIVSGEATLRLGTDTREVGPGSLACMPPRLEHAIHAKTEVVMLLVMIKNPA